jgi:hypothetical protein
MIACLLANKYNLRGVISGVSQVCVYNKVILGFTDSPMPENHYPSYKIPKSVLADLAFAALLGRKRRFRAHAVRMMLGIQPPPRVLDEENMPCAGPGIITMNHYHSQALWPPWLASAISALVPVDIHWVMAAGWTDPRRWLDRYKRALSGWVLTRLARVYRFSTMPPMPPSPDEVAQRTASIMRLMSYVRSHPQTLVGMAPEGGDQPGAVLNLPPSGFGKLALAFSRMDIPFYPVGVYEEEGNFYLRFGPSYRLDVEPGLSREQQDLLARRRVMDHIAVCLPARLRGEFTV